MELPAQAFMMTDWSAVPATEHPGETGKAFWGTVMMGDVRIRHKRGLFYFPFASVVLGSLLLSLIVWLLGR